MSWYIKLIVNTDTNQEELDIRLNQKLAIAVTPFLEDNGFIKTDFFTDSFYEYLSKDTNTLLETKKYTIISGNIYKNIKEHFKKDMLDSVNSSISFNGDKFISWDRYLELNPEIKRYKRHCLNLKQKKKQLNNNIDSRLQNGFIENIRSSHPTNYFYNPN